MNFRPIGRAMTLVPFPHLISDKWHGLSQVTSVSSLAEELLKATSEPFPLGAQV